MRTGQYFKDGFDPMLDFEPDFYSVNAGNEGQYPKERSFITCATLDDAERYLKAGYVRAMIEAEYLIGLENE